MKIRKFYDMISPIYPFISFLDSPSRKKGLGMADVHKEDKVLCIGFGDGMELKYFAEKGCSLVGIDCSNKIIRKYGEGSPVVCGDIRDLPFQDKRFDLVYSAFVVDLFDDMSIVEIVKEIGRVVRDDGRVVILTNCEEKGFGNIPVRFYKLVSRYYPVRNRVIDIERLVNLAGFRCVEKIRVQRGAEGVKIVRDGS